MLPDCIEIYNNNIHSTIKYTPAYLFNCNDKNIIENVINYIKNSQNKKKYTDNAIKNNSHCLLSNNFDLKGYLIKKKIEKKGTIFYTLHCCRLKWR